MLSCFCMLQRLLGNYPVIDEYIAEKKNQVEGEIMIPKKNTIVMGEEEYEGLLSFVREEMPETRDYRKLPHPADSLVLRPRAIPRANHRISEKLLVTVLKPNNCVLFSEGKNTKYVMK